MFLLNNILTLWFLWHFFEAPKKVLLGWKNFILFNLNYFSIPLLLKTFFSPWRKYRWSYGRGFDPARYFETAISNLFSRFIGMIMRSILVLVGLAVELFIILAGLIVFFGWLFLPLFLIAGLYYGFRQLLL